MANDIHVVTDEHGAVFGVMDATNAALHQGKTSRLTRDELFMGIAELVSERSTCYRGDVGCIITDAHGTSVVSMGYNGNAAGLTNGCDSDVPGRCGCIHAEMNALLKAPYHGITDLVLYTTASPCVQCAKLIINSKVTKVVFKRMYRSADGLLTLLESHIGIYQLVEATLVPLDRGMIA